MLDAGGFDEAVATAQGIGGCGFHYALGHNYQIADISDSDPAHTRIVDVETASRGRQIVTPVVNGANATFHANTFLHLTNVREDPLGILSSEDRLSRVAQLPSPRDVTDIIKILGDTKRGKNANVSIYRTGPKGCGYTLQTVIFDLRGRTAKVLAGNPMNGLVVQDLRLDGMAR